MITKLLLIFYFHIRVDKSYFSRFRKQYFLQTYSVNRTPKNLHRQIASQAARTLYWRVNVSPYIFRKPLLAEVLRQTSNLYSYTTTQRSLRRPSETFLNQKALGPLYYRLFSNVGLIIFSSYWRLALRKQKKSSVLGVLRANNFKDIDRYQQYFNRRIHNFLRFAKKQLKTIYKMSEAFRFWHTYSIRHPRFSKSLWILHRSQESHARWLRQKKRFRKRQRIGYWRRRRMFPHLDAYRSITNSMKYYIPRRLSRLFSQSVLLRRIKKARLVSRNFNVFNNFSFNGLKRGAIKGFFSSSKFLFFLRSYSCLFVKKKKNNFYLTVTNGLGEVKLFFSSGSYLIRSNQHQRRRNKKLRASFRHFNDVLKIFANKLKKKKIFFIRHFMRPNFMRSKHVSSLVYTLTGRSITIGKIINLPNKRHCYAKKTKKARRL